MHLIFAQGEGKLSAVNKNLLPSHLRRKVEKFEMAQAKARQLAQHDEYAQKGRIIPHVTQFEAYDMTYKQAQRGKRAPRSEKLDHDFTQ